MSARLTHVIGAAGVGAIIAGVTIFVVQTLDDGASSGPADATVLDSDPHHDPVDDDAPSPTEPTVTEPARGEPVDGRNPETIERTRVDGPTAAPTEPGPDTDDVDAPLGFDPTARATAFLEDFIDAQDRGDLDHLRRTLHPAVTDGYGPERCERYLAATVGSVDAVWVNSATFPESFDFETPDGTISFDEVIRAEIVFATPDDVGIESTVHLPLVDGEPTWLTHCGAD